MEVFRLDLELVKNRPDLLSEYEDWLSAAERERYLQLNNERRKLEFLCGHALLHDVVGMMTDTPPQHVMVELRHNVPFLETIPLYVNLSHSGGLVAVVVDEQPVGLDIERSSARRNISAIVEKHFGNDTAHTYNLLKPSERRPFFFRVWTMREAAFKWQTLFVTNQKLMDDLPQKDRTYEGGGINMPVHFYSGVIDDMYFTVASENPLVNVPVIDKVPKEPHETLLSPKDTFLV